VECHTLSNNRKMQYSGIEFGYLSLSSGFHLENIGVDLLTPDMTFPHGLNHRIMVVVVD
jgi:hypothetical protein